MLASYHEAYRCELDVKILASPLQGCANLQVALSREYGNGYLHSSFHCHQLAAMVAA